jgi:APA family basic amino acid/polyamine antiporter
MTGARVTFAQARDGLLFGFLAKVNPRFETPAVALWTQFAMSRSMVLALKNFQDLADSFVFTMWIFYGLAAASVFTLRRKHRHEPRPFRVPGYPIVPIAFILASLAMTVLAIMNDPKRNGAWLLILLAGAPGYFVWHRWFPSSRREHPNAIDLSSPPR